mgnify:CR=1 FL=1
MRLPRSGGVFISLREGDKACAAVTYKELRDKELSGWVQYHEAWQIKATGSPARVCVAASVRFSAFLR